MRPFSNINTDIKSSPSTHIHHLLPEFLLSVTWPVTNVTLTVTTPHVINSIAQSIQWVPKQQVKVACTLNHLYIRTMWLLLCVSLCNGVVTVQGCHLPARRGTKRELNTWISMLSNLCARNTWNLSFSRCHKPILKTLTLVQKSQLELEVACISVYHMFLIVHFSF